MLPTFAAATVTPEVLGRTLREVGACILKDFPCHDRSFLEQQVRAWGEPILEARNLDGGMVFDVTVDHSAELPAYASTPYDFDCHTDCAEFTEPPDTVLLLCEQSAEQGGESLWVPLDAVIPHLSYETLRQLQKHQFYFKGHVHSILSLGTTGEIEARYQPLAFTLNEQLGVWQKTPEQAAALDEFAHAVAQEVQRFTLAPGDCFVFHNRRSLHGRTAFQGARLLKRVRFNFKA